MCLLHFGMCLHHFDSCLCLGMEGAMCVFEGLLIRPRQCNKH